MPIVDLTKLQDAFVQRREKFPEPFKIIDCPKCAKTQPAYAPSQVHRLGGDKCFCSVCGWVSGSRHKVSPNTRAKVYQQDNHECVYCGEKENLTLDHIIPFSHGGGNTANNFLTACKSCNSKRGNRKPINPLFGRFRG